MKEEEATTMTDPPHIPSSSVVQSLSPEGTEEEFVLTKLVA